MANETIEEIIESILLRGRLKYLLSYRGQVKNLDDPDGLGRAKVIIPSLGWDTEDKGVWANPLGQNGLITPAFDDWVLIEFIEGKPDDAVIKGTLPAMKTTKPSVYESKNSQVLFEDPEEKINILFKQSENELSIGKKDFKESARKDDTTVSSNTEDSAFWGFFSAFFGVITGAPINEPGNGSPSALQAALALAISGAGGTPTSQAGKIDSGSSQVKIGDK